MPIIELMTKALNTARQKYQSDSTSLSYLKRLERKEAAFFLEQLHQVMSHYTFTGEREFYNNLRALLAARWQLIAQTPFSYLCQSQHYLTELCCQIAQALHQENPKTTPYQLMMPSLIHLQDLILYLYEQADDCPLDGAILSDDGHSLIPVALLASLSYKGNVNPKMLVNPYTGEKLSEREFQRLKNHNPQAQDLVNTYELIQAIKSGNNSAGGHVNRLITALRKGGEHGQFGGKESEASTVALNGIITFMNYWEHVPKERQSELKGLKSSGDKLNFGQLLDIITKTDQTSLDCVESLAGLLEKNLEENTQSFYREEPGDLLYLMSLFQKFDTLQNELSSKISGQDQQQLEPTLLVTLNAFAEVDSAQDLLDLIKLLSIESFQIVQEQLKPLIHKYIQSSEDLENLFVITNAAHYSFIFSHLHKNQEAELAYVDFIINTLARLNTEQREAFFKNYKNHPDIKPGQQKQLIYLISYLPENHRKSFLAILGPQAIDWFTLDSLSLKMGLKYLNMECCEQICAQLNKRFPHIVENGVVLGEILEVLDAPKKTLVFHYCRSYLSQIIKNGQQFASVLLHLDEEQSRSLCDQLINSKTNPLKNSYQLCQALFLLPANKRHLVFISIQELLPGLITKYIDFGMVLRHMNEEDQQTFRDDLKKLLGLSAEWQQSDEVLFKLYLKTRQIESSSVPSSFFFQTGNTSRTIAPSQGEHKQPPM